MLPVLGGNKGIAGAVSTDLIDGWWDSIRENQFPGIYQFGGGGANPVVLLLEGGIINYWIRMYVKLQNLSNFMATYLLLIQNRNYN